MSCLNCSHDCSTLQWRRTYPSALKCCPECTCYRPSPIPAAPRIRLPTDEERDAKWRRPGLAGPPHAHIVPVVCRDRTFPIVVHEAMLAPLQRLFDAIKREGMQDLILSIDGYGPRPHHRHGVAIDINREWNPLGKPATGEGTVLPLVPLAVQCGFLWRPYAARHFELDPARF